MPIWPSWVNTPTPTSQSNSLRVGVTGWASTGGKVNGSDISGK